MNLDFLDADVDQSKDSNLKGYQLPTLREILQLVFRFIDHNLKITKKS